MEYFEAALNLKIIMFFSTETETRLKKSKRIICLANVSFYSLLFGFWAIFQDWLFPGISYQSEEMLYVFGMLIL